MKHTVLRRGGGATLLVAIALAWSAPHAFAIAGSWVEGGWYGGGMQSVNNCMTVGGIDYNSAHTQKYVHNIEVPTCPGSIGVRGKYSEFGTVYLTAWTTNASSATSPYLHPNMYSMQPKHN